MKPQKIYSLPGFEFCYIRSKKQLSGTMHNFAPHWWIQYLGNGQSAILESKAACLAWIQEFNAIGE